MIREVTMYQAVCDGCGGVHISGIDGESKFLSKGSAYVSATVIGNWKGIDGKLYCTDCIEYDEETDSYKPKKEKN